MRVIFWGRPLGRVRVLGGFHQHQWKSRFPTVRSSLPRFIAHPSGHPRPLHPPSRRLWGLHIPGSFGPGAHRPLSDEFCVRGEGSRQVPRSTGVQPPQLGHLRVLESFCLQVLFQLKPGGGAGAGGGGAPSLAWWQVWQSVWQMLEAPGCEGARAGGGRMWPLCSSASVHFARGGRREETVPGVSVPTPQPFSGRCVISGPAQAQLTPHGPALGELPLRPLSRRKEPVAQLSPAPSAGPLTASPPELLVLSASRSHCAPASGERSGPGGPGRGPTWSGGPTAGGAAPPPPAPSPG
ncbi:hypothetical protein VULLAG_LOCUS23021 [Vulpes lagopus]